MRTRVPLFLLSSFLLITACSSGDAATENDLDPTGAGGSGGAAGKGGSAGQSAGSSGSSAGQGGSDAGGKGGSGGDSAGAAGKGGAGSSGASGQGGAAGKAGSGQAGDAGSGKGGAGVSGSSGQGGAGSGQAGDAGSGQAGDAGSGQAGDGGAGQAGSQQAGGAGSGQAGDAGSGQGGAGSGQAGDGGSGQAGDAGSGQAGDAGSGQAGDAGSGQAGDAGASGNAGSGQAGAAGSASGCDDPSLGSPCASGLPGACASGHLACVQNVLACVADVQPGEKPEVCDGVDNNCDGTADEGAPGANQPCTIPGKLGLCGQGTTLCDASGVLACQPLAQPTPEVCDGQDNDCDGNIDDNPTDTGVTCDTGKLGACAQGVAICSQGAIVCSALAQPTPEDCNGIDDDCDGNVDDGLPDLSCGIGECATTSPSCLDGKPQLCFPKDPQAETCDGKDNNCDGQVDDGNVCCAVELRCGDLCCGGGQVCSFQKCVQPGVACFASEDCASGEYCDYSLGTVNNPPPGCQGTKQKTGKCMPKPPSCAQNQDPGDPPVCVQKCEYKPVAPTFEPALKYSWGGKTTSPFDSDIMMTPIVVQLDDDDCDGQVNERDIPEIVFSTFASGSYNNNGTLHAISIVNGAVKDKWALGGVHPTKQLAGGNLDGQPGSEIVVCGLSGNVRVIKPGGTELWSASTSACFMPSIADLDQDGKPEVVTEGGVYDGATGALKNTFTPALTTPFILSDIDGDGKLDIVTSGKAYRSNGTLLVDTGLAAGTAFPNTGDWKGPWAAVADFDLDGKPEVVGLDNFNHTLVVWRYNASAPSKFDLVRGGVDINGSLSPALCPNGSWGNTHGGGPVTVGDFNADGTPDIAFAGGVGYAVIDGKKLLNPAVTNPNTFLWGKQTTDCSSASTGSSLFDFNGDGKAEVIYSDEQKFRIYEGATGNILFETCNTTATLSENPIVADVDNDGQADIVVASNAYAISCNGTKQSGIRVFSSKNNDWVRTRRIWNQHAYHVTNVNEDGSIPKVEASNWTQPGLNNFRQNKQPGGEFAAPDLVISVTPTCSGPYALIATLRNLGEAPVGPGVKVGFYTASGAKLGEATTLSSLYPAGSETLTLSLGQPPSEDVYVVADDASAPHSWVECRTNNNKSATTKPTCAQ